MFVDFPLKRLWILLWTTWNSLFFIRKYLDRPFSSLPPTHQIIPRGTREMAVTGNEWRVMRAVKNSWWNELHLNYTEDPKGKPRRDVKDEWVVSKSLGQIFGYFSIIYNNLTFSNLSWLHCLKFSCSKQPSFILLHSLTDCFKSVDEIVVGTSSEVSLSV